jgi:hypothetical protein
VTEQCRSVRPSVTCVSSVLAFAHARSHSSETTTSHLFYNQQFGATIRLSATTRRAIPTLYSSCLCIFVQWHHQELGGKETELVNLSFPFKPQMKSMQHGSHFINLVYHRYTPAFYNVVRVVQMATTGSFSCRWSSPFSDI